MEAEKLRNVPGVIYHGVKTGKLRRYFDWKNFTDPFRVAAGAFQSAHLMGKIKPDVCFSKGGFVAVPVVFGRVAASRSRRLPRKRFNPRFGE